MHSTTMPLKFICDMICCYDELMIVLKGNTQNENVDLSKNNNTMADSSTNV